MVNPFCDGQSVSILKEAFPSLSTRIIEDKLIASHGDVNRTFELLLALTDPSQATAHGPPIPNRPSHTILVATPPGVIVPPVPNPFLNAKPLSVREELAVWRNDLREESKRRTDNSHIHRSPGLSISNMFRSNSSMPSLPERRNHRHENMVSQPSFQRPYIPTSRTVHNVSNLAPTPTIHYQSHNRSSSNPSNTPSRPLPPALPRRRQSSNHFIESNNENNPFINTGNSHTRRPVPIPDTHQTDQNASFNPFEEENDMPPPAYTEIQSDTIVNLAP